MAIDKCIKTVRDAMPDLDDAQAEALLAEVVDIVDTIKSNNAAQRLRIFNAPLMRQLTPASQMPFVKRPLRSATLQSTTGCAWRLLPS